MKTKRYVLSERDQMRLVGGNIVSLDVNGLSTLQLSMGVQPCSRMDSGSQRTKETSYLPFTGETQMATETQNIQILTNELESLMIKRRFGVLVQDAGQEKEVFVTATMERDSLHIAFDYDDTDHLSEDFDYEALEDAIARDDWTGEGTVGVRQRRDANRKTAFFDSGTANIGGRFVFTRSLPIAIGNTCMEMEGRRVVIDNIDIIEMGFRIFIETQQSGDPTDYFVMGTEVGNNCDETIENFFSHTSKYFSEDQVIQMCNDYDENADHDCSRINQITEAYKAICYCEKRKYKWEMFSDWALRATVPEQVNAIKQEVSNWR